MEKDMTKGSPMKLILGFAVPLLFGLLFQQFYSMVDAIIVGHYLGVDALAAVGATGSVNFLIIGFCMFFMVKTIAAVTARFRHEEEEKAAPPAPAGPTAEELLTEIRDLLKEKNS